MPLLAGRPPRRRSHVVPLLQSGAAGCAARCRRARRAPMAWQGHPCHLRAGAGRLDFPHCQNLGEPQMGSLPIAPTEVLNQALCRRRH